MRIEKFEQTVFITKENKNLTYLEVGDRDGCNAWSLSVQIGGETIIERTTFPYTESRAKLFLPVVNEKTEAVICLEPFLERPEYFKITLKPVKEISIKIISASHEDLGYCAYANQLGPSCRDYIVKAMDVIEKQPNYKYMIEHYWMLDAFDKYAKESEKECLKKHFKNGSIGLGASFCGVHTSWQSKEQLIRGVMYARDCKEKWGISPKTVICTDVAGISSSVIEVYSKIGIKYVTSLENIGFRSRPYRYKFPMLFKWKAKNSDASLIGWHQIGYSLPALDAVWKQGDDFVLDDTKAAQTEEIINAYIAESGSDYDIIPLSFYHDREIPSTYLADICEAMNKRWKSPRFSVSLMDEVFQEIEEKCGEKLPVFSGELVDQWADFAAINSKWIGKKRAAQNVIREAEAISIVNSVKNGARYPKTEIDKVYWKMGEFDEHCFATSAKNPQKMHIFNMKMMKEQNADLALSIAEELLRSAIGVAETDAKKISLWNFVPGKTRRGVIAGRKLQGVKCQELAKGEYITEPIGLNGFSGKVFSVDNEDIAEAGQNITSSVIDTGMYVINCNFETGNITSIVDKENGAEIIDSFSEYKLGDFIYVHDKNAKLTLYDEIEADLNFDIAKTRKFAVEQGEVATVIRKTAYEEQMCANVEMTVIFYKYEKNIDIRLSYKNALSMMGSQLDRYKKNIFFAFPFNVKNHSFYTQTAADILLEPQDRLKNGPHDFVVAESWVAVANEKRGVALYSKEMPLFHLGGIHYDDLSCDVEHKNSSIFLYAASNRCNNLVFRSIEDCSGEFNLSILPYVGGFNSNKLNLWSEEKNHPYKMGDAAKIFDCGIETDNNFVSLCAIKKAEKDKEIVLRFYNESLTKQHFSISLPFKVEKAEYVSLNEQELLGGIEVSDSKKLNLCVEGTGYATVKAKPERLIESDTEKSESYIDETFWFIVENDKTVICFKKHNMKNAKGFEVYADGELVAKLKNEEPEVQFCEIERLDINSVEVKAF